MKYLLHLISIISLTASAAALVSRDRRADTAAIANPAANLQARHKGSKSRSRHDDDDDDDHRTSSTRTVTRTVTVTVTRSDDSIPTGGVPAGSATTTFEDRTKTTSSDDLAPITLITIDTVLPTSASSSDDSVVSSTSDDDDLVSTTVASSDDSAATPVPNDLAPVTLITLSGR
ncbi:Nn.00g013360.m01.CDS01 [Neocucurbitaria sp. VM-36]